MSPWGQVVAARRMQLSGLSWEKLAQEDMDNDPAVWLSTYSILIKKNVKIIPTLPSSSWVNGRIDFFFLLFCRPIYLTLIGITLLLRSSSGEEGRLSETRDSNEISQTLHHVEFLMIILHFVDNQQNVLNQAFLALHWIKRCDYTTHFSFL